ncbi:MAG: hypothetical protein J6V93_03095 [Clostridia bacterium]|nr:hypothetical protein [Clostridia bacterium]
MKRIALLLALLLALTPVLASCTGSEDDTTREAPSVSTEATDTGFSLDTLPELDFDKKEFGIFIDKGGAGYLIAEEETGDLVTDAVFQRNLAIEEKFNLTFNMAEAEVNHPNAQIKNYILADDKTFHTFVNVVTSPMLNMVLEGYFVDWNELEYLDYTKPYWNSRIATDINYGGKVYVMGGDLNLTTYNSTNCIMFNQNLFEDLGIDFPYDAVYNYTWTVDKFIEIIKQGYSDLDGNTEISYEGDRFGFSGWSAELCPAVYIGMGGKPVINDENNLPVLNLNNERTVRIFDKIIEIFDNQNAFINAKEYNIDKTMRNEGRILMDDSFISFLTVNRSSDFRFGVVPYPMLDEEQGEYNSRAANIAHLCYIPTTNKELEETGIILEAMSIESYNNVRPVYYDVTLSLKEAPDTETIDMVDMILASSTYMYEGFVDSSIVKQVVNNQTNTFSSWYAGNEPVFKKTIKKMVDFYGA